MGFKYVQVKEIRQMIKTYKDTYWKLRENYEWTELDDRLPLEELDEIILKFKDVTTYTSKFIDFSELESDIEFIEEYYLIKRWPRVNTWLSNTESTLIENHKSYIKDLSKRFKKTV